ncbi:MAG: LysM peptidoglycan-binding domain-containing protein [Microbacteriaceae bacterium]|nr:LysM peptidoglycan-binding domain-containing protein [Microbacteriaceae bacterium]
MTAITGPAVIQPRLRITRRGRAVVAFLAAVPLIVAAYLGLGLPAQASGAQATAAQASAGLGSGAAAFTYVSVEPGQSLWQLANDIAPEADPREVVADILALNNLRSADVQPGQELAIPMEYAP